MTGPIGLYQPGTSVLHRLPAGPKLLILLAGVIVVTFSRNLWFLAGAAVVVVGLYVIARIPVRVAWAQVWPMRWLLLVLAGFQVLLAGWQTATLVCGGLLISVALAALITLTTRVTALLDLCVKVLKPLRRFGIDPDRVGLVLALTIRSVPLLVGVVNEVNEARRARCAGFSLVALVAPAVVRSLRHADAMGDALIARGVDD